MSAPRVSVVVPTRNAGPRLDTVLDALDAQKAGPVELIAVDSCSTDGTQERLRARGVQVVQIGASDFNHGETRNLGLARTRGELAVLLVQDAVPASPDWLQHLIAPFSDVRVAGTFGRQRPLPTASRITTHYLSRWSAAGVEPRIVGPLSRTTFDSMTPVQRHEACAFDNVCSCVRMSVWRRHPFRRTVIAEDLQWAAEVLLAGHAIAYAPDAVVWHSHDRPVTYELKRTYLVHQRLQEIFGLSTIPTPSRLARAVAATLPLHLRLAAGEPKRRRLPAALRGVGLAVALPLGQYLGAKSAREGRDLLRVQGV